MVASSASAATGEDEADRYRFPFGQGQRHKHERPPRYRAFFEELSRLNYVEGQNLGVERYSGEGRPERYAELAHHVVNTHPDLVFALGTSLALAFKMATATIPIVIVVGDPIATGIVASIARPGSNITGVTNGVGQGAEGKRVELLVEAMPKLSTLSYLVSRTYWEDARGPATREAAKRAGILLKAVVMGGVFNELEYQRLRGSTRAAAKSMSAFRGLRSYAGHRP